ncbi:MAG: UbiA family prenyltransferase [Acidobacteriota bacterium]
MNSTVTDLSTVKTSALRYLSCLRLPDIVVLQGPPLLGAAFALRQFNAEVVPPLCILLVANVFLMAHVFTLNDWSGLSADLADRNKAAATFTARGVERRGIGRLTVVLLAVSLVLFSVLGAIASGLALAIAALSTLYSVRPFNWKGRPFLSSVAHLAGGILHFLLGYSLGNALDGRGLAIATFFALIFTAGHLTQEIRDYRGDAESGITTNAVMFGQRRTFLASLVLFGLAHLLLLLLAFRGIVARPMAALAILFPLQIHWSLKTMREGFSYGSLSGLRARYRALYAVVGLAMAAALLVAKVHA